MDFTNTLEPRRSRATPSSVTARRAVRAAIADVAAAIPTLQVEAAFLRALSAKAGTPGAELHARQLLLERRLTDAATKLEAAIATLPETLRNHPRIKDVRGALTSVR